MEDEFKWDVDSLTRILNTRAAYMWPYEAEYNRAIETEIQIWLENNCKGEYTTFFGRNKRSVSFKNEEDYTLFVLTWS